MSRSYDIFVSHSGAQKKFVEHLNAELDQVCGHYSVFFDQKSIKHGEQISTSILEYAGTCKLVVAVVSEEYFTRSIPPMMELAASYTAAEAAKAAKAGKAGNGFRPLPCLLPVFLALRPEVAKDWSRQLGWRELWDKWEVNETMSERRKSGPRDPNSRRVQPTVWKEALDRLLDTRGPIYSPQEYGYDPRVFLKKVAQVIAGTLDALNEGVGPSSVGGQRIPPYKEVYPSEDTGEEEDSSENSGINSGSGSSRVAGKVTDENLEALPEPYSAVVCINFGSTSSSFSFSHIADPENMYTHNTYPGNGSIEWRTVTGIYYCSRDGGQSYQVKSWGNPALTSYKRDEQAGKSSEHFVGIYVTMFSPQLKGRDTQISTTKKVKLPYQLLIDRAITDYLHKFGVYILHQLQDRYGLDLTMKTIQWCVPVPPSWGNAAQEKMKTCMEAAGLINGADGSPHPVKMGKEPAVCDFRSRESSNRKFVASCWD